MHGWLPQTAGLWLLGPSDVESAPPRHPSQGRLRVRRLHPHEPSVGPGPWCPCDLRCSGGMTRALRWEAKGCTGTVNPGWEP